MALIKCKECGKEISDTAKSCPECGFVYKKDHSTIKTIIICICTLVGISFVILFVFLIPKISDFVKDKQLINSIIGEYKLVNTSNESIMKNISITKNNISNICNPTGRIPPEIKDGHYYVYENNKKQYVITTAKSLGSELQENILMEYDKGKLISSQYEDDYFVIKCESFSTPEKFSNIQIEFQK